MRVSSALVRFRPGPPGNSTTPIDSDGWVFYTLSVGNNGLVCKPLRGGGEGGYGGHSLFMGQQKDKILLEAPQQIK